MSWQRIETYRPGIDPTDVLVAEGAAVDEARWHADERQWWWAGNDPTDAWGEQVHPDHWQPLPMPPDSPGDRRRKAMSLRKAINEKCRECIYDPIAGRGTWRQQTEACTSLRCPLFLVRPRSSVGAEIENQANLPPNDEVVA